MIEPALIQSICQALKNGNSVNRSLPNGGKIVFDQVMPYLCVYRYPAGKQDIHLTGLLNTQAAYILIREDVDINELLMCIAGTISSKFEALMIMEMWSGGDSELEIFKIFSPTEKAPATTKALQEGLEEIQVDYPKVKVKVIDSKQRHPQHLPPLLSIAQSKQVGCLLIGLEVPAIYKHADEELFALLYRKLRIRISKVLKKAAFEFIRVQTNSEFTHYMMLGKTKLTQLVRSADKAIAEVSEKMDFLLRVTPVNTVSEWKKFKENHYKKEPSFNYRLISLDPEIEKRKLYNLELERIEDPTLALLLRNKRRESELELSMLEARETEAFRHMSQSLYGEIPASTMFLAQEILRDTTIGDIRNDEAMKCRGFARLAGKEVDFYARQFPEVKIGIQIRQDVTGLMVSKSNLLVGKTLKINPERAEALIQHEVGTHILTYCNGKRQPIHQMYTGLDSYDKMQEGLAVLTEYLVGGLTPGRLRLLAARVIAADMMIRDSGFIPTFEYLKEELGFKPKAAFDITTRIFRGGGLTKDAVYLRGLEQLLNFLKKGGKLETLYIGKFDLKHVDLIEELVHRGILKKPVMPRFLDRESVKKRIKRVREGLTPLELINDSVTKQNI